MVSESLKTIYKTQGIETLSKQQGTKFFIDELSSNPDDIQVVIWVLGWEKQHKMSAKDLFTKEDIKEIMLQQSRLQYKFLRLQEN